MEDAMTTVVPGDIVDAHGQRYVVIDVIEDSPFPTLAALRSENELVPLDPLVKLVDELEVVGHLTEVPGWEEVEHGLWVKNEVELP